MATFDELLGRSSPMLGQTTYELRGPDGNVQQLSLVDADPVVPLLGQTDLANIDRRMRMLFDNHRELEADFSLDLAISDFDDDTMLRFAQMRAELQQPNASFWSRVTGALGFVGRNTLGRVIDGLAWVQDQTFNRLARGITHDATATIGGLVTAGLRALAGDDQAQKIFAGDADRMAMSDYMANQGLLGKTIGFLGDVFIDPFVFLAPLKSVRTAGALLEGTQAGTQLTKAQRVFKPRSTWQDMTRMMRGDVKFTDAIARGATFGDLIKRTPAQQDIVRLWAQAGDDPTLIARAFPLGTDVPEGLALFIRDAAMKGGDDLAARQDAIVDAFDELWTEFGEDGAAKFQSKMDDFAQRERALVDEIGDLREIKVADAGGPLSIDLALRAGDKTAAATAELAAVADAKAALSNAFSAYTSLRRIPRSRITERMKRNLDGVTDLRVFEAPGIKQIANAMGVPARAFRSVARMNPQGNIRPDDLVGFQQVQRMGQLMEDMSQSFRSKAVAKWTDQETRLFTNRFMEATDEIARRDVLQSMEQEFFLGKIGLSEKQLDSLRVTYTEALNDFVAYVRKDGKVVNKPQTTSQLLNNIPMLDPLVVKRVSKMGAVPDQATFTQGMRAMANDLNNIWKKFAVARPAWAVRVVMLSEVPRLAVAGMPNPMTHPFLHLAMMDLPGVSKAARKFVGRNIDDVGEVPWAKLNPQEISATAEELGSLRIRENPRSMGVATTFKWSEVSSSRWRGWDSKTYVEGWVDSGLNNVLANDAAMRRFAAGDNVNDVARWAAETREGQVWASQLKLESRADIARHLSQHKEMFELWVGKGPARKQIIENIGRLDHRDVQKLIDDGKLFPPQELPSALWAGTHRRPGMKADTSVVNRTFNNFFNWIATKPTLAMARQAPYRYQVLSEIQRQSKLLGDVDVQRIFRAATGETVENLTDAERILLRNARDRSANQVKQVLYDLAESGRAADAARFVAPFANAWQEEVTRWAMLAWARPHVPAVMMNMWQEKENLPITVTDNNGEQILYVPFGEQIMKLATLPVKLLTNSEPDVSFGLAVPWNNLNIVTGNGFLPGGGPWLQLPAKWPGLRTRQDSLGDLARALDPFNASMKDIIISSPFLREGAKFNDPATTASAFRTALAEALYEADGDFSKVNPDDVAKIAKAVQSIGVVTNLLVGGGFRPNIPSGVKEMADYARWVRGVAPEAAERLLVERYGEKMIGWMTAQSEVMSGQPPTKEAESMFLTPEFQPLAEEHGKAFWALFGERARGDFDHNVYLSQIERGHRERLSGDEFYQAAVNLRGWQRYGELLSERDDLLAAMGWVSLNQAPDAIRAEFSRRKQAIFDAYPGFEVEQAKFGERQLKRDQHVASLRALIETPQAQDLRATEGARRYFDLRDSVVAAMSLAGMSSLLSEQAKPLREAFITQRNQLLAQYPDFRQVYTRLGLEFDQIVGTSEVDE